MHVSEIFLKSSVSYTVNTWVGPKNWKPLWTEIYYAAAAVYSVSLYLGLLMPGDGRRRFNVLNFYLLYLSAVATLYLILFFH